MPKKKYQELSSEYDRIANLIRMSDSYYKRIIDYILKNLDLKKIKKILDAGCGNGLLIYFISKNEKFKHFDKYAFDISEQLVKQSRSINPNVKHSTTYLPKTEYEEKYFDIIIASSVLEHLAEPYKSLVELRRILSDSGSLIIVIPNGDRIGLKWYLRDRKIFQPADDYFYTFAEAQYLFRKSGFRIYDYLGISSLIPITNEICYTKRLIFKAFNKLILNFHPDIDRMRKYILFHLKKEDYFLNHDY